MGEAGVLAILLALVKNTSITAVTLDGERAAVCADLVSGSMRRIRCYCTVACTEGGEAVADLLKVNTSIKSIGLCESMTFLPFCSSCVFLF